MWAWDRHAPGRPNAVCNRVILAALVWVLSLALTAGATASPPAAVPVDPEVRKQLAEDGSTVFWVVMGAEADLSSATTRRAWKDRGDFVVQRLQSVASQSQQSIRRLLEARGVEYEPFWIANAIRASGDRVLVDLVAAQPGVKAILADRVYELPEPTPAEEAARIQALEWGIERINADDVWATYGVRGEGIVVANIDTGVQYNHPALAGQYRGNLGGGSFDHNYNWWDPSSVCGSPSLTPCDNNGHGTHTMGTIVGDDGGVNQVGVAPGARWIAAKGCESSSCSTSALLSSGQWVLAPTNLAGLNPRTDLRPHIVNNSWGSANGADTWYQATVQAWRAAGIFPVFSNGNSGPACGTAGSPGSYPESYGVGAFDISNSIVSSSSRGASAVDGGIKPDISAPGVSVRSAVPTNGYASLNGTSMAAPHVAGAIALMWSAAPALVGDLTQTSAILDSTAVDVSDLTCGGSAGNNNVWGEGRLDVLAAVNASPIGPTGTLTGIVSDASSAAATPGARVELAGPMDRTAYTNASGVYSVILPVGTYSMTVSNFGYVPQSFTGIPITTGGTAVRNAQLNGAPTGTLSGTVIDGAGRPAAGAKVEVLDTPLPPATTASDGSYAIAGVPAGTFDVRATPSGACDGPVTVAHTVNGSALLDLALPLRTDATGYYCTLETPAYVAASNVLPIAGDDAFGTVALPFALPFYGGSYGNAYVSTNGFLSFLALASSYFSNQTIPGAGAPNAAVYPFWDDLYVDPESSLRSQLLGVAPDRRFVIEWRNVRFFGDTSRLDIEAILHEDGRVLLQYRGVDASGREQGNSATIGIENVAGTIAHQYSFNQAVLNVGETAIMYHPADATAPTASLSVPAVTKTTTLPVTVAGGDNVGVTGYFLSESMATPAPSDPGWAPLRRRVTR